MPISKNWSKATTNHIQSNAPNKKGIYELRSFGETVYIGSSKDLKNRLLTHLNERNPNYYRYQTVGFLTSPQKKERKHYDQHVEKTGSSPRWNDRRP
ncbi:DUF7508 domain-containing protein [Halobellus captivus]|uniref:DUF7508 domain-containing protein n=1 Tax=Halobellus captivus TaxID=2592614 RepID=UPI0011A7C7C7